MDQIGAIYAVSTVYSRLTIFQRPMFSPPSLTLFVEKENVPGFLSIFVSRGHKFQSRIGIAAFGYQLSTVVAQVLVVSNNLIEVYECIFS